MKFFADTDLGIKSFLADWEKTGQKIGQELLAVAKQWGAGAPSATETLHHQLRRSPSPPASPEARTG